MKGHFTNPYLHGGKGFRGNQSNARQQPTHGPDKTLAPGPPSEEEYLGMVKSYNDRRGFGFVACEATASKYGRDVYIAKAEAALAFAGPDGILPSTKAEKANAPSLAEEDLIRFRVRLSVEGYPQAEQIRRMHKFHGMVVVPPPEDEADHAPPTGRIASEDLAKLAGHREVFFRRSACGQVRLVPGEKITFCVQGCDSESYANINPVGMIEALLVVMAPRPQMAQSASVLSCFVLTLPRLPLCEGWPARPDLRSDCHALNDRIIMSNLPSDVDEAELMRFFIKQGSAGATVAHARGSTFASVAFPSQSEVARFVARSIHTFADDKETRLARLHPRGSGDACGSRLPGLPQPSLSPGDEAGILHVLWSPVVLAISYVVELRPAGVQANWSMVDAVDGRIGSENPRAFDGEHSSCKAVGLPSNIVFEARVTYFTNCGCRSDPSESSDWCIAVPSAAPQSTAVHQFMPNQVNALAGMTGATGMKINWGGQVPDAWSSAWQQASQTTAQNQNPAQYLQQQQQQQQQQQGASWRCVHGTVIPPPSMPELRPADESGYALMVQWPSVGHASAYVVELREPNSPHFERFIRSVPAQALGSLVELRIGGLRPGAGQGRMYIAQIRSVAPCGCESEPSPPGVSVPLASSSTPMNAMMPQVPALSLAAACGATQASSPTAVSAPSPVLSTLSAALPPATGASGAVHAGASREKPNAAAGAIKSNWSATPATATATYTAAAEGTASSEDLPNLLSTNRMPPVPPPAGPPPTIGTTPQKDIAPEVAGNEECIILD